MLAAYAIVRLRYRGAQWVGAAIFLAYLIPPSILFIPLATVVFQYGLFDTPFALILTQAGVSFNGRSDTVINGQRSSHANVTMDGINIQDNYIRDNAVDYTPNLLLLDQVRQGARNGVKQIWTARPGRSRRPE